MWVVGEESSRTVYFLTHTWKQYCRELLILIVAPLASMSDLVKGLVTRHCLDGRHSVQHRFFFLNTLARNGSSLGGHCLTLLEASRLPAMSAGYLDTSKANALYYLKKFKLELQSKRKNEVESRRGGEGRGALGSLVYLTGFRAQPHR